MPESTLTHLECAACGARHDADVVQNLCTECGKPLLARYDLDIAARTLTPDTLAERPPDLWRYREVLPVRNPDAILSLGEGGTPLQLADWLGETLGCPETYIKDESLNPTGSFKARGLAMAVSRALELGVEELAIPSAGNAAGAMSAYAALAGIPAHVFMPEDVPPAFKIECQMLGADVTLVPGLITDAGARVKEGVREFGWFDVSTLKEPYRIEGKKTMGYELAEQFGWELPDVIIYPTGGGTGLIGMWKAFDEMEQMGLIGPERPRMVSVQSSGCAPIVRAFEEGLDYAPMWEGAETVAAGLRVPAAIGDFLILQALRESNGRAVAVADEDIMAAVSLMGATTGIFPAPEGAATLAAQIQLLREGWIQPNDRVVLYNTGSGLKYTHLWE
jgi:threonine synthase